MDDDLAEVIDISGRLKTLQWIMGGLCAGVSLFGAASIPWAMRVQANVSSIQTTLSAQEIPPAWFKAQVAENTSEIESLEKRINQLERKP